MNEVEARQLVMYMTRWASALRKIDELMEEDRFEDAVRIMDVIVRAIMREVEVKEKGHGQLL